MNQANHVLNNWNQNRDSEGFLVQEANFDSPAFNDCVFKETCPESHDSTVIVTFSDDSQLEVTNPAQCAFACYVSVI